VASESVQTPPNPEWDGGVDKFLIGLTDFSIFLTQEMCTQFFAVLWA